MQKDNMDIFGQAIEELSYNTATKLARRRQRWQSIITVSDAGVPLVAGTYADGTPFRKARFMTHRYGARLMWCLGCKKYLKADRFARGSQRQHCCKSCK